MRRSCQERKIKANLAMKHHVANLSRHVIQTIKLKEMHRHIKLFEEKTSTTHCVLNIDDDGDLYIQQRKRI